MPAVHSAAEHMIATNVKAMVTAANFPDEIIV